MFSSLLHHSLNHTLSSFIDVDITKQTSQQQHGAMEFHHIPLKRDALKSWIPLEISKGHISSLRIQCDWNALLLHPIEIHVSGLYMECMTTETNKSDVLSPSNIINTIQQHITKSHAYMESWIKQLLQRMKIIIHDVHITVVPPSSSSSTPSSSLPFTLGLALSSLTVTSTSAHIKTCDITGLTSYLVVGERMQSDVAISLQQRLDEWITIPISPPYGSPPAITSPTSAAMSAPTFPYILRPIDISVSVTLQPHLMITSQLPDINVEMSQEQMICLLSLQHLLSAILPTQLQQTTSASVHTQPNVTSQPESDKTQYGWSHLEAVSPWLASLVTKATTWGWHDTSDIVTATTAPISDQQAEQLIQQLQLEEERKIANHRVEMSITTGSLSFQLLSKDIIARVSLPSSSLIYTHDIQHDIPTTSTCITTPNIVMNITQSRIGTNDTLPILTCDLKYITCGVAWSTQQHVVTRSVVVTLADISIIDGVQTNPALQHIIKSTPSLPQQEELLRISWSHVMSEIPTHDIKVTCNNDMSIQYNPYSIKIWYEIWKQMITPTPPLIRISSHPAMNLSIKTSSSINLKLHIVLQHVTICFNKDMKSNSHPLLTCELDGVDVITTTAPIHVDACIQSIRMISHVGMNGDMDILTCIPTSPPTPLCHIKYHHATATSPPSLWARTNSCNVTYQHQLILEMWDYIQHGIIDIFTTNKLLGIRTVDTTASSTAVSSPAQAPTPPSRSLMRRSSNDMLRQGSIGLSASPLTSPRRHTRNPSAVLAAACSPTSASPSTSPRLPRIHITTQSPQDDIDTMSYPHHIHMDVEMGTINMTIPSSDDKNYMKISWSGLSIHEEQQHMKVTLAPTHIDIHTPSGIQPLLKHITCNWDIERENEQWNINGNISSCHIAFTPISLQTCIQLIQHHLTTRMISQIPISEQQPRIYSMVDDIPYKYGVDMARSRTDDDTISAYHMNIKWNDITIAIIHATSALRILLSDITIEQTYESNDSMTATCRIGRVGMLEEIGSNIHKWITHGNDDIKTQYPPITTSHDLVIEYSYVTDEQNESWVSWNITYRNPQFTLDYTHIWKWINIISYDISHMIYSCIIRQISRLKDRNNMDHHSLILEISSCHMIILHADTSQPLILTCSIQLQYETSIMQSSCTLTLSDTCIYNNVVQDDHHTILFPTTISCDMGYSMIGMITSPLTLSSSIRTLGSSPAMALGSDSPLHHPRSRVSRLRNARDSPSTYLSPTGRWQHTMDYERGSTRPEPDSTPQQQGHEPMQIDANISITPIDMRISYQDMKAIYQLMNGVSTLSKSWTSTPPTTLSPKNIASVLGNNPADRLISSFHPNTVITLSINISSCNMILIDDCQGRYIPLLSCQLGTTSSSLSLQSHILCILTTIPIECSFYNINHSEWHTIVHPVTVACEARVISTHMARLGDDIEEEKKEDGKEPTEKPKPRVPIAPLTISLFTPSPVDIRLSHTLITTCMDTYTRWYHAWDVVDVSPSAFIPYRIINDTGCNIQVWTDADEQMGRERKEIGAGGEMEIKQDAQQTRSRTHTIQAGTLTLNVAFERATTMDILHRIQLEHIGKRAYPLLHVSNSNINENRVVEYVLVDIVLKQGCRVITLSSPISIINHTHTELSIELEALTEAILQGETKMQHHYTVKAPPQKELSLPIHLQHWTGLCITPHDQQQTLYQRTSSITRDTQDDMGHHIQQLIATDANGIRMYFHVQSQHQQIDVTHTEGTITPIVTLPHTTLIISTPFQLHNMYPFGLTFRLYYSDIACSQQQCITPPHEITLLCEKTLQSSQSCDILRINGYASGTYWLQFQMEGYQYSSYIALPTNIQDRINKEHIITTSCFDTEGRIINMVMRVHDPEVGARQFIWSADYWILNHTNMDLLYGLGGDATSSHLLGFTQRTIKMTQYQQYSNHTWVVPTGTPHYVDTTGQPIQDPNTTVIGWAWNNDWTYGIEPGRTDTEGWMYADTWNTLEWSYTPLPTSTIRKREMIRQAMKIKAPTIYCDGLDETQRENTTHPMAIYVPKGSTSEIIQRSMTGMEENSCISLLHPPINGISRRSDIGIHVATAPGGYGMTRIITLTPRYIIVNHSNVPFYIGQTTCQDGKGMVIPAGQQISLHWDDASNVTGHIRINPDPAEWCDSTPFPIHSIGRLVVKCRHRTIASSIKLSDTQQRMLWAITIRLVDATLVVSCELEDLSQPSYRIENTCGLPIQFRQIVIHEPNTENSDTKAEVKSEKVQRDWFILDSDQSIPYAWDTYEGSPPFSLEVTLANANPVCIKPDDMGAYTSLTYGDSREIIHVYVLVEGATNIVRISRTVPMNRGIAFGRKNQIRDDPVRAINELISQLRVTISQLNIALVDDSSTTFQPILTCHLHQLRMSMGITKQAWRNEIHMTCAQLNHPNGKLPVIMAIGEKPKKSSTDDKSIIPSSSCLSIFFAKQHGILTRHGHTPVSRYDYINIDVKEFISVQLEQGAINTITAFVSTLPLTGWSTSTPISDLSLVTPLLTQTDHTLSTMEQTQRCVTGSCESIAYEYHVTEMRISSIRIQLTTEWDITNPNISSLMRLFGANHYNAHNITFPTFASLHQTFTWNEFISMLSLHYHHGSHPIQLISALPNAPSQRFVIASCLDQNYVFGDLTKSILKDTRPITRVMSRTRMALPPPATSTTKSTTGKLAINTNEGEEITSPRLGRDSPTLGLIRSTQMLGRGIMNLIRTPLKLAQQGWSDRVLGLLQASISGNIDSNEDITETRTLQPVRATRVLSTNITKDPMNIMKS